MPSRSLRVLYLSAEAHPFATAGGLGEVASALPRALRALIGETPAPDVRLVIPYHGVIRRSNYNLDQVARFQIPHENGPIEAEVFQTILEGLPVYLIAGPVISSEPDPLYSMDSALDGLKFSFFSLAALELARALEWQFDILHANDWHTSPAVYALALLRQRDPFFKKTASLLTIHNLPYLGLGAGPAMNQFGLPPASDSPLPAWAQNAPLPIGLWCADHISTVSPGYAQEILTAEFGSGLHEFLRTRQDSISGILNGLDLAAWDPATDPEVRFPFSYASLSLRSGNKHKLQEEFDLPAEADIPLLAMVTRFDHQKGVDLAIEALRALVGAPWQAILLGTGNPDLERAARILEDELPDRVRAAVVFNKTLSRRIFAGSDMLLMPSRYEPCGLTQMIAMRYGCLPLAHATGGLRNTIEEADRPPPGSLPGVLPDAIQNLANALRGTGTGFLFEPANTEAMLTALRRALAAYQTPAHWRNLQVNAMQQDFSWERSARQTLALYQRLHSRFD